MTYTAPKARNFREKGGDLDSKICSELSAIDAEIDTVNGAITTLQGNRVKYAQVALTAGNANAFCMAWQNPTAGQIMILKLIIQIGTAGGTAGALLNFGTGATATTASDNLIDGMDANATGLYDNIDSKGTNGKATGVLTAGQYLTGQILVQNAAALVAVATIEYI